MHKQQIKTPALIACPRCNNTPKIESDSHGLDLVYRIWCPNCNLTLSKYTASPHRATMLWNNRTSNYENWMSKAKPLHI
jgi:hypothetical protein